MVPIINLISSGFHRPKKYFISKTQCCYTQKYVMKNPSQKIIMKGIESEKKHEKKNMQRI